MVRRQLSRMRLRVYTKVSHLRSLSSECRDCCIKVIGGRGFNGIYDRDLVCKDDLPVLGEKEFLCERLA